MCTFPFVPSRLADAAIKSLLDSLKDAAKLCGGSSRTNAGCVGSSGDERIVGWGENGNLRRDWEAREL